MADLTILVTGVGAPGIMGTLYSIKRNFDNRKIKIIGTDIRNDVVGRYLCDKFYQIPRPNENDYLKRLLSICRNNNVDLVLPQNTSELETLAENKDFFENISTKIIISNKECIMVANNKYKLMEEAKNIGIPVPRFYLIDEFKDLIFYAKNLGWPEKPVVIKPPISNGMRGLRIVDESLDLKEMFYNEKPTGLYLKMNQLKEILGESFPELLVMEFLPGEEYSVDILRGNNIIIVPRKRDLIRSGITFNGTVERNKEIIKYSKNLSKKLGLQYAFGFQFKLDEDNVPRLLECNPRVQGTMVLSTFAGANIIYGAIKYALNEKVPNFDIKWGTRILRYWGGIKVNKDELIEEFL